MSTITEIGIQDPNVYSCITREEGEEYEGMLLEGFYELVKKSFTPFLSTFHQLGLSHVATHECVSSSNVVCLCVQKLIILMCMYVLLNNYLTRKEQAQKRKIKDILTLNAILIINSNNITMKWQTIRVTIIFWGIWCQVLYDIYPHSSTGMQFPYED